MKTSVWKRSEDLFHRALECPSEEREAFIRSACEDDAELLAEIRSLLDSYYEAAARAADTPSRPHEPVPAMAPERRIGAYRIECELGQGGMGAVFLASRADEQYTKNVAIKLVRTDLATSFFAGRLRHERQILAELEHPNIARLLDGGVTGDGQPFLVMEYVAGAPIDVYCNARALSVADRLRLFIKICGAVHYAHQRLVIHRDLKPANILVTTEGEPKLLDFGIAKLIESGNNAGETTEMMMATPLYASPELMYGQRATTASDVYSLGVILYSLLTGHSPYSDTAGLELLNAIVSGNIVKPSAAAARASLPGVSASTLERQLRGDLDHIVLRALRREPQERYASAELLAEDVRRHLESLPVMAGSGSLLYDARKFVRRNRIPVAAGVAVAAALIGATGFSLHHSRVAAHERVVAQQRLDSLRKLTGTLLSQLHDSIQSLPGATQARKLLVQSALEYLNGLDTATHDRAELTQLAEAYRKIGDVQGNPTNANLGDTAGALASYSKAREIAERLLALDPADRDARAGYALLLQRAADTIAVTGDVPRAVDTSRKSLDGFTALERETRTIEARQKVGTAHIKLGDMLGHPAFPNLGDRASALGHYQEALTAYEGAGRDALTRRYLGIIHERIGKMMEVAGRKAEALTSYERSFEIRHALATDFPANANARRDLAIAHEKIGDLLTSSGKPAQALPRFEQALVIFEALHTLDPSNANAARAIGIEYEKIAETATAMRRPERAREFYTKARTVYTRLAEADALNARARSDRDRVDQRLTALTR